MFRARLYSSLSEDARDALSERSVPPVSAGGTIHDDVRHELARVDRLLRERRSGVPFHAAACRLAGGRGLMLPGHSRSGKSTLTLALGLQERAHVVSDDTVWLDEEGVARGYGRPLTVREGSPFWGPASSLYEPGSYRAHVLVLPEDLGAEPMLPSVRVDVILFPTYRPGGSTLRQLSPVASLCRLLASVLRPVDATELAGVARVVCSAASVAVGYSSLVESLELCRRSLDVPPSAGAAPSVLSEAELGDLAGEVIGVRVGDGAALLNRRLGEVAHLESWPEGSELSVPSWSGLKSLVGVAR